MDERLRFVARLLEGEKMAALCAEFGISRKTGYKIFDRYKACGVQAFTDRLRHCQARKTLKMHRPKLGGSDGPRANRGFSIRASSATAMLTAFDEPFDTARELLMIDDFSRDDIPIHRVVGAE
jgi:AraC-like DNA-binding protein